ncbi:MAG: hypothetical protein ACE14S_07000 [Candidatus Bathyarchaeia archaeon]
MRCRSTIILCFVLLGFLLLAPLHTARAQTYIRYRIQLNADGSASWVITQVSDLRGTVDTWDGFVQKVAALIDAAASQTQRQMSLDYNSLQLSTSVASNQSKTTEYLFTWLNFSVLQNGQLTLGDVFRVEGFFNRLYGDGALEVAYPSGYMVKSVFPSPDERVDAARTLEWLGTQLFASEQPSITLTATSPSPTPEQAGTGNLWLVYVVIGVVSAVAAGSLAVFLVVRRRKRRASELAEIVQSRTVESEEEKILKVIRGAGGSTFQSTITEQCRFSKAKTSQLLKALEHKGVVRRYKKGRDKIVTLVERSK